jgi:hypothetical protein
VFARAIPFTREVHILDPQVIDEFLATNDASDDRAGVGTHTKRQPRTSELPFINGSWHIEGSIDQRSRVVWPGARYTRGYHVAVPNRLDLLQAVLLDQVVEALKYLVKKSTNYKESF